MTIGIYKRTGEHKKNMAANLGKYAVKGCPSMRKGKKFGSPSKETRKKISIALKGNKGSWLGKRFTKEHKHHISSAHIGLHHTEATKRMMSEMLKGANGSNWRGGISYAPYSVDWTATLKRSIRERDKYTCQACGKEPAPSVHHIDYDKQNCNPDNLVTLCRSCHSKTIHNRKTWIAFFHAIKLAIDNLKRMEKK